MDKSEVKYTEQKGKLKFEGNFRVEESVLALKSEIQELKVVLGKVSDRICDIPNWMKTDHKNKNSTRNQN